MSRTQFQWFPLLMVLRESSIVSFFPSSGFPRRGHLPSPDIVVVAVRLLSLGHAAAAAAAPAAAAAAAARHPISYHRTRSSRTRRVREGGTICDHPNHRPQPRSKHTPHHLPSFLFSELHRTSLVPYPRSWSGLDLGHIAGSFCPPRRRVKVAAICVGWVS